MSAQPSGVAPRRSCTDDVVIVSGSTSSSKVAEGVIVAPTPVAPEAGERPFAARPGAVVSVAEASSVKFHWSAEVEAIFTASSTRPETDFTAFAGFSAGMSRTYFAPPVRLPPPVREKTTNRRSAPKPPVWFATWKLDDWNQMQSVPEVPPPDLNVTVFVLAGAFRRRTALTRFRGTPVEPWAGKLRWTKKDDEVSAP